MLKPLATATLLTFALSAQAQQPTAPPPIQKQVAPTSELLTQATKLCTAAMTDAKANAMLSPAPFIQNCIDDVKLSGTFTFVDGHKSNYLAKVQALTKTTSTPSTQTKLGTTIAPVTNPSNSKSTLIKQDVTLPPKTGLPIKPVDPVRDACTKALTMPDANKILSPAPYIQNCVADIKLSGRKDIIDTTKAMYLAKVKAMSPVAKKP